VALAAPPQDFSWLRPGPFRGFKILTGNNFASPHLGLICSVCGPGSPSHRPDPAQRAHSDRLGRALPVAASYGMVHTLFPFRLAGFSPSPFSGWTLLLRASGGAWP
jgi:hypothetical protein